MAQKLWEKNVRVNEEIDRFTVGRDREMDLYLAKHDVLAQWHISPCWKVSVCLRPENWKCY